jgi:hypothetical protein
VLADGRTEQLLDPMDAGIRRELLQELLQFLGALLVRRNLDVVEQEDFVEPDFQVRNEILPQEAFDAALDRLPDRRIAGRSRPYRIRVAAGSVVVRARDVAALEGGADAAPESDLAVQPGHWFISCIRFRSGGPPVRCP